MKTNVIRNAVLVGLWLLSILPSAAGEPAEDSKLAECMQTITNTNASSDALYRVSWDLAEIGLPAIAPLCAALKDQDGTIRKNAAWVFASWGWNHGPRARQAIPTLIAALNDKNPEVRAPVCLALAMVGATPKHVVPSLTRALSDPDPATRSNAAESLGAFGSEAIAAAPALLGILNDTNHQVCLTAVSSLKRLGRDLLPAVPGLIGALKDADWENRKTAAEFLGEIGARATAAAPALGEAINDDESSVRQEACNALARMGPAADAVIPTLLQAMKERPGESFTVYTLEKIDPQAKVSMPALVDALRTSGSVRMGAFDWLERLGSNAVPTLTQALGDADPQVRSGAAAILGAIGPAAKPALAKLADLLNDTDEDTRSSAAKAISRIDPLNQLGASRLVGDLKAGDEKVRQRALDTLQQMGPGGALTLLEVWGSPDIDLELRRAIASTVYVTLRKLDDADENLQPPHEFWRKLGFAVPTLVRALAEEDREIRLNAVVVLQHLGPEAKAAVPALIKTLKDDDFEIRFCSARALGAIGPDAVTAVPSLIEGLEHEESAENRYYMAQALRDFGGAAKPAVPALTKTLKDEDSKVRRISARALGAIGADAASAILPLVDMLSDDALDCRTNSAGALGAIAADLKERMDTGSIPALQAALHALEQANFQPKAIGDVREPLTFLQAQAAAGRGPPPSEEEAARCLTLVVQVSGELDGEPVIGSGIIFGLGNDKLYIATARHVVRRGRDSTLRTPKISIKTLPGEPVAGRVTEHSSIELDLAVIEVSEVEKNKIPTTNLPFNRVGKPQSVQAAAKVFAFGLPVEHPDLPRQPDEFIKAVGIKFMFQSATVEPGYSGGALFNDHWQLVGMIRADQRPFIEAVEIGQILAQLKDWGYPVKLCERTP